MRETNTQTALTAREKLVVAMISHGFSAKETAIRLDIAPRTVEKHVDHVRLKLRAKNRAHMIRLALELGIIAEPSDEPDILLRNDSPLPARIACQ